MADPKAANQIGVDKFGQYEEEPEVDPVDLEGARVTHVGTTADSDKVVTGPNGTEVKIFEGQPVDVMLEEAYEKGSTDTPATKSAGTKAATVKK